MYMSMSMYYTIYESPLTGDFGPKYIKNKTVETCVVLCFCLNFELKTILI